MEQTPEQQAKTLVEEMANSLYDANGTAAGAIDCALIAVKKAIEIQDDFCDLVLTQAFPDRCRAKVEFWQEVQTAIEKMK